MDKFNCNTLLHLLNVTTLEIGPEMGLEMGLEIVGPDDRYR